MNHAEENASLTEDFLGLAGQARRLLNTDEHQTSYDTTQLARFKLIYHDELEKLAGWLDEFYASPMAWSNSLLVDRISFARAVLDHWSDPRQEPPITDATAD